MSVSGDRSVIFHAAELLPEAWRGLAADGPVRTFNPGLIRDGVGWLFAYRIVAADGLRRIGLCRLYRGLRVIEGSAMTLSDYVTFRPDASYPEIARHWFADPRLYRFGDRLFTYWNTGWHEPRNHQFLQELEPETLRPVGHARELLLRGERQKLEKNWTLFADEDGALRAIYSVAPHRVLQFSFAGDGDIFFEDLAVTQWTPDRYPSSHGGLRGGAPPVLFAGNFWSFCHSVHDGSDGYRYLPAVYSFAPRYPFRPTAGPTGPLPLMESSIPQREYPRLNPAVGDVIYPCGSARDDTRWLISHGINDECCAISSVEDATAIATLQPVAATPAGARE